MTEQDLRQRCADIISAWLGATRGSATHLEILRIYNTHTPLARGYKVQVGDAYCATTASACYIEAGIADYTGTECGCDKFIEIARKKGIWQENDAYVPGIGDACLYDWDDSGSGDNRGSADHIGIVVRSGGGTFDVVEGNGSGGRVVKRTMTVNGRYIRGFICPPFKQIIKDWNGDDDMTKEETKKLIEEALTEQNKKIQAISKALDEAMIEQSKITDACSKTISEALDDALGPMIGDYTEIEWKGVREEVGEMVRLGVIDGGTDKAINPDDVNMRLQLLRVLVVAKRYVVDALKKLPPKDEKAVLITLLELLLEELKNDSK